MYRTTIASAAVCSAILMSVAPAQAETASLRVRYADLDLASKGGQAALDRRIEFAVRQICGPAEVSDKVYRELVQPCQRAARDRAKMQVALVVGRFHPQLARR
jgi:UrcA family protein